MNGVVLGDMVDGKAHRALGSEEGSDPKGEDGASQSGCAGRGLQARRQI